MIGKQQSRDHLYQLSSAGCERGSSACAGRRGGSSAQEAARAAFAQDKDTTFYSSDDDDSHSTTSLSTTTSNAGPKFKVRLLSIIVGQNCDITHKYLNLTSSRYF